MQKINSSSKAKNIFDLPRELRDRIYMIILNSEIKPPRRLIQDSGRKRETNRAFAVQPHDIFSFGLLYTSRQTRYEMSHAIARQSATEKDITYKLGCMVYHNSFVPTWTALPAPPCHLRHIAITVRAFDSDPRDDNDSGFAALVPSILNLVNQFFERDYVWWGEWCNIPLIVDTLTLYFPYHDDSLCSRFVGELATKGHLWKKVRKVKFTGMRQNKEWVVLPSWGGGSTRACV